MGINMGKIHIILITISLYWMNIGNSHAFVQNAGYFPSETMIHRLERINKIGKATGQQVSYNVSEIKSEVAPAFDAETNNIEEWLHKSLIESDLTYEKINEKHYLVIRNKSEVSEQQQEKQVSVLSGRITDVHNEPLVGVNIVEKGTSNGTVTDIDGRYSLATSADAILIFSYIGYSSQEIHRDGRNQIDVILDEDTEMLEEVVVVGYGTQRKINLTGSVGVISSEDLIKRPITNISSGLQGLVPGMTVTANANGGLPGQSNASIQIRGVGSRGNNNPLILIDGAEGDMNIINPNDIENISVLKDAASAAIYGNRAANGVILITTKSVSGKERQPRINVDSYYAVQMPTKLPKMADSPTFMAWENEAQANVGGIQNYTQEDIQKAIDGTDPNYYANTIRMGAFLKLISVIL